MESSNSGSHFPFLPADSTTYDHFLPFESKGNSRNPETPNTHHRCSSESFLEKQPSWLDDLLNDSEIFIHKGHRRSASDSYAYLGDAAEKFSIRGKSQYESLFIGNLAPQKDVYSTSIDNKINSLDEKRDQVTEEVEGIIGVGNNREQTSSRTLEGSADKAGHSQLKPSTSKLEAKRAKQHNAHRSRVRKLQYISHLERAVQILQAEGSEISAELRFLEQQNAILIMENKALRQRLESISQEQIIKHWEQEMLEREIGRLQTLYHLQKPQQMQMHQQQQPQHHPKQRRNHNYQSNGS
ncbi:uncharacterized protein At4g06598-like [Primulina huaijiensis]|uniref:uncharacterized protein At4g06598-like n=1 Tax=Primulina huaijiensis TaxID=1492673 RepID=UPI003CC71852